MNDYDLLKQWAVLDEENGLNNPILNTYASNKPPGVRYPGLPITGGLFAGSRLESQYQQERYPKISEWDVPEFAKRPEHQIESQRLQNIFQFSEETPWFNYSSSTAPPATDGYMGWVPPFEGARRDMRL